MKVNNGAIYHSESNNKAVRVTRAHQAERIAYVKHHNQDINSEVSFDDLSPATPKQVKDYLSR